MNIDYIFKNILQLTAYFSLGEDIGSRERIGARLKSHSEKHEKLVHILLCCYNERQCRTYMITFVSHFF